MHLGYCEETWLKERICLSTGKYFGGTKKKKLETEKCWYWEEIWALERRLGMKEKNHRDWEDLTWAVRGNLNIEKKSLSTMIER